MVGCIGLNVMSESLQTRPVTDEGLDQYRVDGDVAVVGETDDHALIHDKDGVEVELAAKNDERGVDEMADEFRATARELFGKDVVPSGTVIVFEKADNLN